MELTIGDLISSGGTLVFAVAVWKEVKIVSLALTLLVERIAILEERTRHITSHTPPFGVGIITEDEDENENEDE